MIFGLLYKAVLDSLLTDDYFLGILLIDGIILAFTCLLFDLLLGLLDFGRLSLELFKVVNIFFNLNKKESLIVSFYLAFYIFADALLKDFVFTFDLVFVLDYNYLFIILDSRLKGIVLFIGFLALSLSFKLFISKF